MQAPGFERSFTSRAAWAQIWALAWLDSDKANLLEDIRKDPKSTITQLKEGTNGKYKELLNATNSVDDIIAAADVIIRQAGSLEEYTGFLPIPSNPFVEVKDELKKEDIVNLLGKENIVNLLRSGLEGILKFDDQAELWAEVLLEAWKCPEKLRAIRRDPVEGIKAIGQDKLEMLQNSTYGLLPLPGRPDGLLDKDIEKLEKLKQFLGDGDNADHIGGIFAVT